MKGAKYVAYTLDGSKVNAANIKSGIKGSGDCNRFLYFIFSPFLLKGLNSTLTTYINFDLIKKMGV